MDHLLARYRSYALKHGVCTLAGDSDGANAAHDGLRDVFMAIMRCGHGSQLFRFYDDEDTWVQSWAAAHTLEVDEARALEKLAALQKADIPHISTSAKYTIEGWHGGELRFLQ